MRIISATKVTSHIGFEGYRILQSTTSTKYNIAAIYWAVQ